jgi:YVTN family beta-propeller protein
MSSKGGTSDVVHRGRMTAVIATIPVGSYPWRVAVAGGRGRRHHNNAYVTSYADGTVSVISTVTNTVTTTIHGIDAARDVTISPNGAHAYVGRSDGVAVIDTATNTVTTTIPVGGGSEEGVAVSPDGAHLYLTHAGDTVSVIDLATNTVTSTITVGGNPWGVAFTPDGAHAYVANEHDGRSPRSSSRFTLQFRRPEHPGRTVPRHCSAPTSRPGQSR